MFKFSGTPSGLGGITKSGCAANTDSKLIISSNLCAVPDQTHRRRPLQDPFWREQHRALSGANMIQPPAHPSIVRPPLERDSAVTSPLSVDPRSVTRPCQRKPCGSWSPPCVESAWRAHVSALSNRLSFALPACPPGPDPVTLSGSGLSEACPPNAGGDLCQSNFDPQPVPSRILPPQRRDERRRRASVRVR